MVRVLLITAEKRLAQILDPVFDRDGIHTDIVSEWPRAQEMLFRDRYDLVVVDYECLKLEDLDTFITLDNVLVKEESVGILMARAKSERIKQLETELSGIHQVIDMSQGKPVFLRSMTLALKKARDVSRSRLVNSTLETDALAQIELDLPVHTTGNLRDHELARLAYALRIRKESGRFTFRNGPREVTFGVLQGQIIDGGNFEDAAEFPMMFAWNQGDFEFERDESISGDTVETVDLILRGVQKFKHQRDLTEALFEAMKERPIRTNLWEERQDRFSHFGALHSLIRACDGKSTLDEVLASLGSIVNEGFRAAYFALQTDLLVTAPDKIATAAVVLYSREVRQQRQKIADTERKTTKAFRAAESDAGRAEVARELRERTERFKDATPHEVFGVWEGCGRDVVREMFYQLVKEHHPDVYGGNVSDEMKGLAQEIFIIVKNSYQALLKTEREQTVEPPESFRKATREEAQPRQRSRSLAGATNLSEASEAFTRSESQQTSNRNRPIHETPRMKQKSSPTPTPDDNLRTTSGAGVSAHERTTSKPGRARTGSLPGEDDEGIDVKERLKKLSAFKRKRRRLTSPRSRTLSENSEPVQELLDKISESSQASEVEDGKSEPEVAKAEKERQEKLNRLIKKAGQNDDPNAPNPAREAFNRGYNHYKADELEEALAQFSLARRFNDEGMPKTFYAYTKFRLDESFAEEARKMLEEVVESRHRQALADAYLFLGHVLKSQGKFDRALKNYKHAFRLNPKSREAEREVRLAKMRETRGGTMPGQDPDSDSSILKKIFKK